jgi:hypothetical protein
LRRPATKAENCVLKAKRTVATRSSQGIRFAKAAFDVASSNRPPAMPPRKATRVSSGSAVRKRSSSVRKAHAAARLPGQRATELLALAITGGTPAASSAGNDRKVPPPATEFIAPAQKAAMASKA